MTMIKENQYPVYANKETFEKIMGVDYIREISSGLFSNLDEIISMVKAIDPHAEFMRLVLSSTWNDVVFKHCVGGFATSQFSVRIFRDKWAYPNPLKANKGNYPEDDDQEMPGSVSVHGAFRCDLDDETEIDEVYYWFEKYYRFDESDDPEYFRQGLISLLKLFHERAKEHDQWLFNKVSQYVLAYKNIYK